MRGFELWNPSRRSIPLNTLFDKKKIQQVQAIMLFLSSKFLLTLAIIRVAVAVPLGIEYDKTTGLSAGEQANKGRLDTATAQAHTQVTKMREGLNKYKAGDAKAKALYEASFGKNADVNEVDKTISHLEHGNIKAKVATHPFKNGEIAAVPWSKDGTKPWTAGHAQFSKEFHGSGSTPLNDAGRAGTIIHEATHQLSKTGDDVNKSGKIIRPHDGASKPSGATGYTSNHNMHKTVAHVNADKDFTAVRDSSPNMHHNAESYAVFGSLCSQPGALRRRDVHLYVRALVEGDDDQLMYLSRRNSCKLPANHFAKKAAEKKAAAAKAGAKLGHQTKATPGKAHSVGHKAVSSKAAGHVKAGRVSKPGATHSRTAVKGAARAGHGSKVLPKAHGVRAKVHAAGKAAHGTKAVHAGKAGAHASKLRTPKSGKVAHTAKIAHGAHTTKSRTASKTPKAAHRAKATASHPKVQNRVAKARTQLPKAKAASKVTPRLTKKH